MWARRRLGDSSKRTESILRYNGQVLNSKARVQSMWRKELSRKCDGVGLAPAAKVPQAHSWVSDGTSFLSGRDYISCIHVRYNCLFSKSRAARGRVKDHNCSRGCGVPETLNHILQQCHATHFRRIQRHNAVVNYLSRSLAQRGYTVHKEPVHEVAAGVFKPDLVAYSPQQVIVIDAQVVNDQLHLDQVHRTKALKYESALRASLQPLRPRGVLFTTCTTNWRGVFSAASANDLLTFGAINKKDLRVVSTRVLLGGVAAWRFHQHMATCNPRLRERVG